MLAATAALWSSLRMGAAAALDLVLDFALDLTLDLALLLLAEARAVRDFCGCLPLTADFISAAPQGPSMGETTRDIFSALIVPLPHWPQGRGIKSGEREHRDSVRLFQSVTMLIDRTQGPTMLTSELKLLAQATDVRIHGARVDITADVPDIL